LIASFSVAREHCADSIVNDSCYEDILSLRSARATNDRASLVDVSDKLARFRGKRVGLATGRIETIDDGNFDLEFAVRAIEVQRLELIDSSLDKTYPTATLAYLTNSAPELRHVKLYFEDFGNGAGAFRELRGTAEFTLDRKGTEANLVVRSNLLAEIQTGAVPGSATLSTSSGAVHTLEIVGPERIAALKVYESDHPVTSVALGNYGARLRIIPLLDQARAIAGCSSDEPQITVSSPNVHAEISHVLSYCALDLTRDAPGNATITIAWGNTSTIVEVRDAR
jgi:hypothetical protein